MPWSGFEPATFSLLVQSSTPRLEWHLWERRGEENVIYVGHCLQKSNADAGVVVVAGVDANKSERKIETGSWVPLHLLFLLSLRTTKTKMFETKVVDHIALILNMYNIMLYC